MRFEVPGWRKRIYRLQIWALRLLQKEFYKGGGLAHWPVQTKPKKLDAQMNTELYIPSCSLEKNSNKGGCTGAG
ncbi:MAG: hypothetical protein ACK5R0_10015 [Bacteroidota bacterium]